MASIKENNITISANKISLEERNDLAKFWINSANDGNKFTFSPRDIALAYNNAVLEADKRHIFKNFPVEAFQIRLMRFLSIVYNTDEKLGMDFEKEIIKECPEIAASLGKLYYRADMLPDGNVFKEENIKLFLGELVRSEDIKRLKISFRKKNKFIIFEGEETYICGRKFRYKFRCKPEFKLIGIQIQRTTKRGKSELEFKAVYKSPNGYVKDDMNLSDEVLY